MSHLALFLMGMPRIEREGVPIQINRRKATALVAYLALSKASHSRDALTALLWPEYDGNSARAALTTTLGALKDIDENWIDADRESISLQSANLWVDVDHFHSLLAECQLHGHGADRVCLDCLSPLAEAVQLYRGGFMAGFTLRDSASFDDWQLYQTESLRREATRALEKLASGYGAQGAFEKAISYAQQWLALEPLDEAAHTEIMRLFAWSGQPAAAQRHYQECIELFEKELGTPPHESTTLLYKQIRENQLAPPFPLCPHSLTWNNFRIPAQPMSFLGREKELRQIGERLANPACRLLTLVGPGGIGKTRLAIQAATANAVRFPNGACFVSLASLDSADLIASTIAYTLEFPLHKRLDHRTQLLGYLRERKMLLVLDNLEHLVGGADILVDILSQAPGIKILATSREVLNLQWEWHLAIQGLEFPQDEADPDITRYSSVQLFLQRAQRIQPGFSMADQDKQAVARICRFLGGIPLGIELAATWAHLLSCQEIAQEMERSLGFLTTCLQDVPERHRSLRDVFEQSWRLDSEKERRALAKLSVFRGGFRKEAAESVAGASLPLLATLMHKSFLRRESTGRYAILEALRQYVEEKLEQSPEEQAHVRDLHCEYYAEFLHSREQCPEAIEEIAEEIENVRAAWRWAIEHKRVQAIDHSMHSLYLFYESRGWLQEGEMTLGQAVEMLGGINVPLDTLSAEEGITLGRALARQGRIYVYRARYDHARKLLRASLATLRHWGAQGEAAFVLNALGSVARYQRQFLEARQLFEESLAICRASGDQRGIARNLTNLGAIANRLGEVAEARELHQASLAIYTQIGYRWGIALALNNLSVVANAAGNYAEAKHLAQRALDIYQSLGNRRSTANCLNNLGYALCALEEEDQAEKAFHEALAMAQDIASARVALGALSGIAMLWRRQGKGDQISDLFTSALYHPAIYPEVREYPEQILSVLEPLLRAHPYEHQTILDELGKRILEIGDPTQPAPNTANIPRHTSLGVAPS